MRGFGEDERAAIEERLVESGRDLFERYGFRKTTVADVTEPVGIAESTFYRFFDSKSALYSRGKASASGLVPEVLHTRVLFREHEALVDAVEAELAGIDDPETQVRRLLDAWVREFEERPLLKRSHEDPRDIVRWTDAAVLEAAMEEILERLTPVIADVQAGSDGLVADLEPAALLELLSVVEQAVAQRELHDDLGWSGYGANVETSPRS